MSREPAGRHAAQLLSARNDLQDGQLLRRALPAGHDRPASAMPSGQDQSDADTDTYANSDRSNAEACSTTAEVLG